MELRAAKIEQFLAQNKSVILVSVKQVKGSTPRDIDAKMLVSANKSIGTIGGGKLEFSAIEKAQIMLKNKQGEQELEISLGIKSQQCCGGFVKLKLELIDENISQKLLEEAREQEETLPCIYLFGAGHVGIALANLLAQMPYKTTLIDSRGNLAPDNIANIELIISPLPEAIARAAKPNSAFVVFTHDHELDFLILSEILKINTVKYVGMIGSKTKKKKFESWFIKNAGTNQQLEKLTCPIGGNEVGDKRPNIIAALTLSEIIGRLY